MAARFGVSVSSAPKWVARYRATGSVAPDRIGGHRPWLLESHSERVHALVAVTPHLTLDRQQEQPASEGFTVCRDTIWMTTAWWSNRSKSAVATTGSPNMSPRSAKSRLEVGLCQTSPAHSPETVRLLPGSEDLLDPGPDPVDRPVPFGKPALGLTLQCWIRPRPAPDDRDPGRAATRLHRFCKAATLIGGVGAHLAGIVRKRALAMVAVMDPARRDRKLFHYRRLGVGA